MNAPQPQTYCAPAAELNTLALDLAIQTQALEIEGTLAAMQIQRMLDGARLSPAQFSLAAQELQDGLANKLAGVAAPRGGQRLEVAPDASGESHGDHGGLVHFHVAIRYLTK